MNILSKSAAIPAAVLKNRLLSSRNQLSSDPAILASEEAKCIRNTDDWVRVWIDEGHSVRNQAAGATATRAITDAGQLIWMVHVDGKRFAYHASGRTSQEAFAQAQEATARRRAISKRWAEVSRLRRDILMFKTRVRPTIADARHAGLCDLGIEGFLTRTGLGRKADYPGYFLALMSLFDRQIAFPLFAARMRLEGQPDVSGYEVTPMEEPHGLSLQVKGK